MSSDNVSCSEQNIIVIDNGSYQCRVGFSSNDSPTLIYKNVVARNRSSKKDRDWDVQVGSDIKDMEAVRWMIRTPFDLDVVVNYSLQELLFDHAFEGLNLESEGSIDHPIIMTEAIANPHSCRKNMSELLFEAYSVPKLAFGIDCLFSHFQNKPNDSTCLIVSSGFQTTHILPVVNGSPDIAACCRINLGGYNCSAYLQRLLQLRYPNVPSRFTLSRMEDIIHTAGRISLDYKEEVKLWSSPSFKSENPKMFSFKVEPTTNSKDNTKQLNKVNYTDNMMLLKNIKKKENRMKELESMLEIEQTNSELYCKVIEDIGFTSTDHVKETIQNLLQELTVLQNQVNSIHQVFENDFHTLNLCNEVVQATEIVFQPSLVGFSQGGITDCIESILKEYPSNIQAELINNVFVTGGNTEIKGFTNRLHNDIMQIVPFGSSVKVECANNPSLDSWLGANKFCKLDTDIWLTKESFEEYGWDYIKQHKCSNIWDVVPQETL